MKLQTKLIGLNLTLILILLISVSIISYVVINDNFLDLEEDNVYINAQRASEGFSQGMLVLESIAVDWSPWDDTYDFVTGNYEDYIETNLGESTLLNMGADFFLVTDSDGNIFHLTTGKNLDKSGERMLNEQIEKHPEIFNTGGITGIVGDPEIPLIISAQSILKTDLSGPVAGTLTLGYFLNDEKIDKVENLVKLPVEGLIYDKVNDPKILDGMESRGYYKDKVEGHLEVYIPIYDIEGEPKIILKTTLERAIFNKGITSLKLFLTLIWGVGILLIISLSILSITLSKRITNPISELSQIASQIGKGKLDQKINLNVENEIQTLASSLNEMQKELRRSKQKLIGANKELNQKVKIRTAALESKVKELEKINKVTMDRELKMIELKKEIKGLSGNQDGQSI